MITGGRRGKILVVDDQPLNIKLIYQILRNDYDIHMATTGKQAIRLTEKNLPDLILLDLLLPDIDGLEVCRRLKSEEKTADIPIIFITGENSIETESSCWQVGGIDFVNKPFNPETLRNRIRSHITLKFQTDFLKNLAFNDPLTGAYNRRAFDERMEMEWRRCQRGQRPLSLAIIDVDHFKKYNDFYGHLKGDEALKKVAASISQSLNRSYDLVARYGGEEFACILPETELEGAIKMGQKVEENIRRLAIPHANTSLSKLLTVSIGVATCVPKSGAQPTTLIAEADQALYNAKKSGRGKVISAS